MILTTKNDKSESLVDVTLYLYGDSLDPIQVSLMLGTEASKARVKGEKRRTSTNREAIQKTGLWALKSKAESSLLSDQITWLKQKLSLASCLPLSIPGVQKAEIDVFIALGANGRGGGDYNAQISPDNLTWLSQLGIPVSLALAYVED